MNILKGWEAQELLGAIHAQLPRRHPDYDGLGKLSRVREGMMASGIRISSQGAFAPTVYYLLGRLGSREQSSAISRMEFRKDEVASIHSLSDDAEKLIKILKGPAKNLLPKNLDKKLRTKAAEARALYDFLEKSPAGLLAFIQSEYSQPRALSAIRMYVGKWKPLRAELPIVELETMGLPRGPKFDQVIEEFFNQQLVGKARNPQDRTALLRKLSGIKPEAPKRGAEKKDEKKGKPAKGQKGAPPPAAPAPPAKGSKEAKPAPQAAAAKPSAKPAPAKSKPAAKPAPAKSKKKKK